MISYYLSSAGRGWEGGVGSFFMYLRAILCTFQISVDLYFVPEGGRGGGEGGGLECILYSILYGYN